jgi:hypothetical protein
MQLQWQQVPPPGKERDISNQATSAIFEEIDVTVRHIKGFTAEIAHIFTTLETVIFDDRNFWARYCFVKNETDTVILLPTLISYTHTKCRTC